MKEKERGREREKKREKRNNYEELVHMTMEAEKSHDQPCSSRRLRKVSSAIQSKSKDLRSSGYNGVIFIMRAGEDKMRCLSSSSETEKNREELLLPLPFVQFRPSMDWVMPNQNGEGHLLIPLIQILISSKTCIHIHAWK